MKEYRIQCYNEERYKNKWVMYSPKVFKTLEAAEKEIEKAREIKSTYHYKTQIEIFRVVSREVSEWEPVEAR